MSYYCHFPSLQTLYSLKDNINLHTFNYLQQHFKKYNIQDTTALNTATSHHCSFPPPPFFYYFCHCRPRCCSLCICSERYSLFFSFVLQFNLKEKHSIKLCRGKKLNVKDDIFFSINFHVPFFFFCCCCSVVNQFLKIHFHWKMLYEFRKKIFIIVLVLFYQYFLFI